MEIDETKMLNWLDFFEISYDFDFNEKGQKQFTRRHVSGHASKTELKELVERINPAKIIPIHTTNLNVFSRIIWRQNHLPQVRSTHRSVVVILKAISEFSQSDNCL